MRMSVVLAGSILAVASVGRAGGVANERDDGGRVAAESQAARTTGEHRARLEPILLALDRRLDAATTGRHDLTRDRLAREAAAFLADWQSLDHSPDLPEVLASAELEDAIRYRIDRRLADAAVITKKEIGGESAERRSLLPALLAGLRQPPAPLVGSGVLSGKVTRSDTSAPVQNVTVQLYADNGASPGASLATAVTNATGDYQFTTLDAGTYYLVTSNTLGLIDQVYAGVACPLSFCSAPLAGTPVVVTSPGTTTGIDFALAPGGRVSGTVTDANTAAPIVGARVFLLTPEGLGAGNAMTDAAGNYTTDRGLASGTYSALVFGGAPYVNKLYDSIPCLTYCFVSPGTPITVTSPSTTTNINFTLEKLASISGVVRDAATSGGLAGVTVQLRDAQGNALNFFAATHLVDGFGNYTLFAPRGTYYVVTTNARDVGTGYLDQVYSGKACTFAFCDVTTGMPVNVASGATAAGIDFALAKAPGGLSGTVTNSATSGPISGASVRLVTEQNRNSNVLTRTTDGAGNYLLTGLPSGKYFVQVDAGPGFVPEAYDNVNCLGGCRPAVVGTPVVVGGSVVTGVNFALDPAPATGSISGKVVAADTTLPLPNVQVQVADASGVDVASASTNATGDYTVTNLLPGTYNARTFSSPSNQGRVYVDEAFSGVPCFAGGCNASVAGTPITVTAGTSTPNINFNLTHGGHLTGKVTSAATSAPLVNVSIGLFDGGGRSVSGTTSDALGNYGFVGLATGSYYARTSFDSSGHVDEVYNNKPCVGCDVRASGTPIAVTAPSTTPNVNFALDAGARISGSVTDAATGAALPYTTLALFDVHGAGLRSTTGDDLGHYRFLISLPSGAYFARATGAGPYMTETWSDIHCSSCPPNAGTAIRVTGSADVTGINFAMDKGGRVAGKVTNASGEPVGADVVMFDSSNTIVTGGGTDVDGNYVTSGLLPSGTYYAATLNVAGYADKIYDNISPYSLPNPKATFGTGIGVTAGATTPSIDFVLDRGGRFSGKVTNAATGLPLANVPVVPLNATWNILDDGTFTDLAGRYTTRKAFPAGNYYALAYSTQGLVSVLYNGVPFSGWPLLGAGTAIPVAANATTPSVDFALGAGGFVSGTVTRTGGAPAFETVVQLYSSVLDSQGKPRFVTSADVDSYGHYRTQSALQTGSYFALATASGYLSKLYNNIPCTVNDVTFPPRPDCDVTKGTLVSVTAPNPTTGINFTLDLQPPSRLFNTVSPCRLVDTRTTDAPALAGGASRTFVLAGKCGIPASAKAVSVNVTITQPTAPGDLRLYPGGTTLPLVSAINYSPGQTRANSAVVVLGAAGDVAVRCDQAAGTSTHFILDVNGYLE